MGVRRGDKPTRGWLSKASFPGNEDVLLINLSLLILEVTFQPWESSQGTAGPGETLFPSSGRKGVKNIEDTGDASSSPGFPSDLRASSAAISSRKGPFAPDAAMWKCF